MSKLPESEANTMKMGICEKCYKVGVPTMRFKGAALCPECMNPDMEPLTLEEYLESKQTDSGRAYPQWTEKGDMKPLWKALDKAIEKHGIKGDPRFELSGSR